MNIIGKHYGEEAKFSKMNSFGFILKLACKDLSIIKRYIMSHKMIVYRGHSCTKRGKLTYCDTECKSINK